MLLRAATDISPSAGNSDQRYDTTAQDEHRRHNGAHYNAAAAALANGRTSEFLHQQLR